MTIWAEDSRTTRGNPLGALSTFGFGLGLGLGLGFAEPCKASEPAPEASACGRPVIWL